MYILGVVSIVNKVAKDKSKLERQRIFMPHRKSQMLKKNCYVSTINIYNKILKEIWELTSTFQNSKLQKF